MSNSSSETKIIIEISACIQNHSNIVIAGHEFPDGDSIGACLALALAIKAMGKEVYALIDRYDEKYSVIPGSELIYRGDIDELNPSLFICVDCSSADRLGRTAIMLEKAVEVICIDHHLNEKPCGNFNYVNPNASATCELIFKLLSTMTEISPDIASAIYAGIVYDTGGFLHQSVTSESLNITARLINLGIPFNNIYSVMMKQRSVNSLKMLGLAMVRFELENGVGYSYVTQEDLQNCGASIEDLDQISGELLSTRGTEASVFIYEKHENFSKASLRSKNINVCDIAKSLGGGGHEKAAGADMRMPVDKALPIVTRKINDALRDYDSKRV